jgi:hypothetical protein
LRSPCCLCVCVSHHNLARQPLGKHVPAAKIYMQHENNYSKWSFLCGPNGDRAGEGQQQFTGPNPGLIIPRTSCPFLHIVQTGCGSHSATQPMDNFPVGKPGYIVRLITHLHPVRGLESVELCLYFPICHHGAVLN